MSQRKTDDGRDKDSESHEHHATEQELKVAEKAKEHQVEIEQQIKVEEQKAAESKEAEERKHEMKVEIEKVV